MNVGDQVRVVLTNKLPQSTVIHFHGLEVPITMDGVPDVTQPPVKPGTVVHLRASPPRARPRHVPLARLRRSTRCPTACSACSRSATSPLPPDTGPVTQQVPMVLNDAGVIGLSINGKSFPATAPVIAKVGDWVEINYFNEGLQIHPMHLARDPAARDRRGRLPAAVAVHVDTIAVAPGQAFHDAGARHVRIPRPNNTPGIWAFHCHILTHAESERDVRHGHDVHREAVTMVRLETQEHAQLCGCREVSSKLPCSVYVDVPTTVSVRTVALCWLRSGRPSFFANQRSAVWVPVWLPVSERS